MRSLLSRKLHGSPAPHRLRPRVPEFPQYQNSCLPPTASSSMLVARLPRSSWEANVSLITPLIRYARIRHLLPTLLHPPRSVDPDQPAPATATVGPSPPPAG